MQEDYTVRQFTPDDISQVQALVDCSESLDSHTTYTYWTAHFLCPELFFVCESYSEIVGFVFGLMQPNHESSAFLWQVGVSEKHKRQGLAGKLSHAFINACSTKGATTIFLTIAPENLASQGLFERLARQLGTNLEHVGATDFKSEFMSTENIVKLVIS